MAIGKLSNPIGGRFQETYKNAWGRKCQRPQCFASQTGYVDLAHIRSMRISSFIYPAMIWISNGA